MPLLDTLATIAQSLSLSGYTPSRVIRDRTESIASYHRRLADLHRQSRFGNIDALNELITLILTESIAAAGKTPTLSIIEGLAELIRALIMENNLVFDLPELDRRLIHEDNYVLPMRRELEGKEPYLLHGEPIFECFTLRLQELICTIISHHLPASAFGEETASTLTTSLIGSLQQPAAFLKSVLAAMFGETDGITGLAFAQTRTQLFENLCRIFKVSPQEALKSAHKIELPDKLASDELVPYIARTPFDDLLAIQIPFSIPDDVLCEHRLVVAGTGTGKTQLIQADVYHYLQREERPGMVIIDSQGQMLPKLERLDVWRDDLIVIDPEDAEAPALNMFALPERIRGYDRNTREAIESDTIKLFGFIFSALSQELTGRQETAFSFTVRLMLSMPGATLRTLRELLEEIPKTFGSSKFAAHIEGLDEDTKSFFKNQFFSPSYVITKQGIVQRLYGVLRVPAFNRMFGSSENRLDLFKELNEGKTILVNTSKRMLGTDASSIFGRYMIALTIGAAFQRMAVQGDHRLALLYIDEAKEYFSDLTLDELLTQVRKYNMGGLIAFQNIDQLPSNLRPVVLANTSTKLVAGLTHHDARVLAPDMRQPVDWLLSMKKTDNESEFACYVRNHTSQAVKLTVPFGIVEDAPQMSSKAYKALREANRRRLAARDEVPTPPVAPEIVPPVLPVVDTADIEDPTKPAREW